LEGLRDRPRRPHVVPHATKPEVIGKIVYLRRNYHFGPHKISMYLKRYYDVQVSPSGVWWIRFHSEDPMCTRCPSVPEAR
jgi:hypothetical protein